MNTEKLINTVETRIEDAKRYTLSTAEYSESIYRHNIDKLNEASGILFVLSLDFAPVNFQEYRETIEGLILDLERKIERVKRYNGWVNYETWNAALWIDNDHGLYTMVTEYANEECGDQAAMARYLESLITEDTPDLNGMYGDILRANMNEIDWFEVAEHFRPDAGWMEERAAKLEDDPDSDNPFAEQGDLMKRLKADAESAMDDQAAEENQPIDTQYLNTLLALRLNIRAQINSGDIGYDKGMEELRRIQADIDKIKQK